MPLALIRSSPAADLNPEQKLAVEYGIGEADGPGPLLVIAGAGSGKTAMLAHRVAALVLAGAVSSFIQRGREFLVDLTLTARRRSLERNPTKPYHARRRQILGVDADFKHTRNLPDSLR